MPPTIKTIASRATDGGISDRLDRVKSNNKRAHTQDSQVCAVNNLAAMPPASAGVGKCTNSMGTTKNPMVLKLAHHNAATQTGIRGIRSGAGPPQDGSAPSGGREDTKCRAWGSSYLYVADRHHLVMLDASRCLNFCRIAFRFSDQRTGNRATNVDQT
jgi:hypothetical protein